MTNNTIDAWVFERAHNAYSVAVSLYGGDSNAHNVVGNLSIALLALLIGVSGWFVFREIGDIGLRLLRLLFVGAILLLLVTWFMRVLAFVYPDEEKLKLAVKTNAQTTLGWLRGLLKL